MGIFDNLDQAQVFENSKWFQPGRYIVEINRCVYIKDGFKGDSFVIEVLVHGAISDDVNAPKPGEIAAHVWNATGDKREIARNTWLGFLCNVFGLKPTDRDSAWWKSVSAQILDDNYLKGTKLYLEVFAKTTQAGNPFTAHNWKGVPTAEQFAEFGLPAA